MNDELLTQPQVAVLLGISSQTVRNWVRTRKIEHVIIADHLVKIPRAEVDRITKVIPATASGASD